MLPIWQMNYTFILPLFFNCIAKVKHFDIWNENLGKIKKHHVHDNMNHKRDFWIFHICTKMTQDFIALYGSMKVRFYLSSPFMFKFISMFDS